MRIIPAKPGRSESYIDMLEEIADWLNSRGFGQLPSGIYRESRDYFSLSVARREVYFTLVGDDMAGALRILPDDPIVWQEADGDARYLHNLCVRRAWNGRGLGSQMLNWAEQKTAMAGKAFLRLDCFADNPILRKYYENAGFEDRGEVDAHYPFGTLRLQRYEKRIVP